MIPRPPPSIFDTNIYKILTNRDNDIDGLLAKTNQFVEIVNPLLDFILAGPFRNYTLHNRDHAKKLVHLADHIISPETIADLTDFECLLIIYSSFLHDMGLVVTDSDVEKIIATKQFQESVASWPTLNRAIEKRRAILSSNSINDKTLIELELADLHCISLANYLRPLHAEKKNYRKLIKLIKESPSGSELFEIRGVSFEEELIDICASHNLDVTVLSEMRTAHEDRFPRNLIIADHKANTQFIAATLRQTDILDFDFERTPPVLIECLGLKNKNLPGSDVSLVEWEKHLSVQQLEIRENELVVKSSCKHPAIESSVRSFCGVIEGEIRRTNAVVKHNTDEITNNYRFKIPSNVRAEIRSIGYVYMDLSLRLDESAIISLLMGTSLYRSRFAAIRELIQNAVDSCSVRLRLSPETTYRPVVKITHSLDEDDRIWINVEDNGIGIDQRVLLNHFFRIGSSFYHSPEFERILNSARVPSVSVVSKFGIGFLSVFMLADTVEISTKSIGLGGSDTVGRRIRIDRIGAIAYVQEDPSINKGALIRIRLLPTLTEKRDVLSEIGNYIKQNILRPPVPIHVDVDNDSFEITTNKSYSLRPVSEVSKITRKNNIETFSIPIEDYSDLFQGKVFLFFATIGAGQELGVRYGSKLIEVTQGPIRGERVKINPNQIFENFDGNRISVGGFRMMWSKLNQVLRIGQSFASAVFDIDVKPGNQVDLDVARTRILDQSMLLRVELRSALCRALKETNIYDRLRPEVKRLFDDRPKKDPFMLDYEILRRRSQYIDDEVLLGQVINALPEKEWPPNVHREVASKLNISRSKCWDAISTLIVEGRVANPNIKEN